MFINQKTSLNEIIDIVKRAIGDDEKLSDFCKTVVLFIYDSTIEKTACEKGLCMVIQHLLNEIKRLEIELKGDEESENGEVVS